MFDKRSSALMRAVMVAVVILGFAGVVAAQDVTYNAMPGADFAKYKTYRWVRIEGVGYPDDIADQQIKAAFDKQFAAKGLTKTDDEKADLYIGYQVAVDKEKQWNAYNTGGGWYGPRWGGMGMGTATSTTINVGTLGLDIYDSAAKQLIWRGAATKTLDTSAKPEKRLKTLDKAAEKLMKNYPPPTKK